MMPVETSELVTRLRQRMRNPPTGASGILLSRREVGMLLTELGRAEEAWRPPAGAVGELPLLPGVPDGTRRGQARADRMELRRSRRGAGCGLVLTLPLLLCAAVLFWWAILWGAWKVLG